MSATESFVRIAMGQSPNTKRAASALFLFACLGAPVVFFAFFRQTPAHEWRLSFLAASVFTLLWLLVAHDIKRFAHGRRVFLNPIHIEAKPENTQARWCSVAIDLGFMLYIAYLAAPLLIANL